MNQAFATLITYCSRPLVILAICLIVFLFKSSELASLERLVAPALAELDSSGRPPVRGLDGFIHEYMANPFGIARELTDRQLQVCRQISVMIPAYESASFWRGASLRVAMIVVIFSAWRWWGRNAWRFGNEGRRPGFAGYRDAARTMWRRASAQAGDYMAKAQRNIHSKRASEKAAVVSNIIACPECGRKLRVPAGKGRIRITCGGCNHRFETVT